MRIGFLYNHDQPHQVAHSLPIALELIRRGGHEVELAYSNTRIRQEIDRIAGLFGMRVAAERLKGPERFRGLVRLADRFWPSRRLAALSHNLDWFEKLDVLVVTERTSLALRRRFGLDRLKMVHARHGAGDRAIGFSPDSQQFDLSLLAGPKIHERYVAAGVPEERMVMTGYVKFDLPDPPRPMFDFEDPDKPVILYNPHPSPLLSSWYRMGEEIVERIAEDGRYNLVFAPHAMLFQRPVQASLERFTLARARRPRASLFHAPNVHVDFGSPAVFDMSYTTHADIYLGDVSSQIYEFLKVPRPALFADAHKVGRGDSEDYDHWRAGPLVTPGEDIVAAIDGSVASHADYRPAQERLFARTFHSNGISASARAADAILERFG
ncbi:hypothetical protein [Sphingomicrobium nitratireducens]|uniref:hypothetical protein n=1 Tax=Sphingomicrobium nitratireducens TaxID=2964666 RepID=UPI0022407EC8